MYDFHCYFILVILEFLLKEEICNITYLYNEGIKKKKAFCDKCMIFIAIFFNHVNVN